jgi:hypothetical protein
MPRDAARTMMHVRWQVWTAASLLVAGCGNGSYCGGDCTDARPDARPDALFDARATDAATPIDGAYVVRRIQTPTTTADVMSMGFDLDGDEPVGDPNVDNQLGFVLSALAAQAMPVQPDLDRAIDRGDVITLLAVDQPERTVHWLVGRAPSPPPCEGPDDLECGGHLTGEGAFLVDDAAGGEEMTYGLENGQGTAQMQVSFFGGDPVLLHVDAAHFDGVIIDTAFGGRVGGMITAPRIQTDLIPALASGFQALVTAACGGAPPSCGCPPDTASASAIALFDANDDCAVSVAEVSTNDLIEAFLAPDVTLDGVDGLSLAFRIETERASFPLP